MEGNSRQTTLHQKFGKRFMEDHIGKMINDPEIALVELVANSWDAGARNVNIIWPEAEGGEFEIIDDGSGMSREEFEEIWPEFNYNRVSNQGTEVIFPREICGITRRAFGRNGKERHSMFCFSNNYDIETWKDGMCHCFQVKRSYGENALDIQLIKSLEKEGHGTKITCVIINNYINEENLEKLKDFRKGDLVRVLKDSDFRDFIYAQRNVDALDSNRIEIIKKCSQVDR